MPPGRQPTDRPPHRAPTGRPRSGRPPTATPDADVELPDWARTDVVAADRVAEVPRSARGGVGAIRTACGGAADGVRGRAGELRDRVTGADVDRDDHPSDAEPLPTAPGTEAQPAFPWSTEEFVAGRDDVDDAEDTPAGATTADGARARPAAAGRTWDATDQIPEDELPWWRRPKDDR